MKLKTSDIVYRDDLYPRSLTSPETVQSYAENLEILPPIEVNQHNILIDGWHRWTAYKKLEIEVIEVIVTHTEKEKDVLFLAIERNNAHGLQLSMADKQLRARELYHAAPTKDRTEFKKQLAKLFSVTDKTLYNWLSRIDKDTKETTKKKVFDLWLACHTQEDIAEECGIDQDTVSEWTLRKNEELQKSVKYLFQDNFDPPIYNVWKQQSKTHGPSHFGNSETRWLENLLYLYTEPFDAVVDPFAGSGSTIDLCKKRGRRYFVSDRKPIIERQHEIRQHDIISLGVEGEPPKLRNYIASRTS